jgi:quercetin dioxygenase-like cupin family protein
MSKNFKLIKKNIDITYFNSELSDFLSSGNNWSFDRSSNLKVHQNTKHIDIRKSVFPKKESEIKQLTKQERLYIAADSQYHELHLKNYQYFKKTYSYLEKFADEIGGQLTRIMVVSLLPGTEILAHIDQGEYYVDKDRYHIPIQTKGSLNICENEHQVYKEGELWWFDNKKTHSAKNEGDTERVHIIFDILPKRRNSLRKARDFFEKLLSDMVFGSKKYVDNNTATV